MSDWVKHVKAYQAKHGGTYGEAMKAARASWHEKAKAGKAGTQKGTGIIDTIKRGIAKVKDALFFPPNKLPGDAQRVFMRIRDKAIVSFTVCREPINSMVDKALNLLSLGTFNKAKKDLGYDKMFHLFVVCHLRGGETVRIEKNERISIKMGGVPSAAETVEVPSNQSTVDMMFEKARKSMGDHRFFQYNAFENNCQDFILGLLSAVGTVPAEARTFIKQDGEALLKKTPGYLGRIAQAATDLAGKISQVMTGQGRKKRGTQLKKKRVLRKKK